MIEEASADAQSLDPKRDWERSHDAVCEIYEIIHSIRAPDCRKNHPKWIGRIFKTILRSEKKK